MQQQSWVIVVVIVVVVDIVVVVFHVTAPHTRIQGNYHTESETLSVAVYCKSKVYCRITFFEPKSWAARRNTGIPPRLLPQHRNQRTNFVDLSVIIGTYLRVILGHVTWQIILIHINTT